MASTHEATGMILFNLGVQDIETQRFVVREVQAHYALSAREYDALEGVGNLLDAMSDIIAGKGRVEDGISIPAVAVERLLQ